MSNVQIKTKSQLKKMKSMELAVFADRVLGLPERAVWGINGGPVNKGLLIEAILEAQAKPAAPELDVTVINQGSICLLYCRSDEVLKELRDNTSEEAQWSGRMLVVEPRYLEGVLTQLAENGFNVPQF